MILTNDEKQLITDLLKSELFDCELWIKENLDNPDVDFQGFIECDNNLNVINKILDKLEAK